MRAVWVTDIHLDFLPAVEVGGFLEAIASEAPDVVLLGGDISTATSIERHLEQMQSVIDAPICFVLGNHDFYHGSIAEVRGAVGRLVERSAGRPTKRPTGLHWLNTTGVYPLTDATAVVGHDGWCDARLGDYNGTPVELSDFFLIDELRGIDREELIRVLRRLGDEAAEHLKTVLPEALASHRRVVLLTHVPPFREATWYDGEISNDDWLPFFCCKAVGDVLTDNMSHRPDRELVVLCGHTHGGGEAQILPNLRVVTGGAQYRHPQIQAVLDIE
jgi:predicted MPP superfamily phosphohydrolase